MHWFANLKTQTKILGTFVVVAVTIAGLGFKVSRDVAKVEDNLTTVYVDYTKPSIEIAKMNSNLVRYRDNMDHIVSANGAADGNEHVAEQPDMKATIIKCLDDYGSTVLRVSRSGKNETKALEAFRKSVGDYFVAAEEIVDLTQKSWTGATPEAAAELKQKAHALTSGKARESLETALNDLDEMVETISAVAGDMNEDGHASADSVRQALIFGNAIVIALALTIGYFIARAIARPLGDAVGVLEGVADGDFTRELDNDSKDEIGQMARALNRAIDSMRTALDGVRASSEQVSSAASQLSSASSSISSGAQESASSLEETAASLEEITSTVKQNADNAQQASQLAQNARDVATGGGQVVENAVTAMGEINQSSKKIADIITTIDEIAFQTNLLALNAAVEAARAGEQGRGFAVVAAEVRNLAQRSAGAAKEIKGLIQDSVRKVENGSELVTKSGQTLREIVSSIKRVTDIVAEIAAASKEQSSGIEQVNTAVAQMDSVTQQNASQTEELSGTAESMASQAQKLRELVARFRLRSGDESMVSMRSVRAATRSERQPAARPSPSRRASPPAQPEPQADISNMSLDDVVPIGSSAPQNTGLRDKGFEEF